MALVRSKWSTSLQVGQQVTVLVRASQPSRSVVAEVFGMGTVDPGAIADSGRNRPMRDVSGFGRLAIVVVALGAFLVVKALYHEDRRMTPSPRQEKAQAAWDRIEALGGHGVWEDELVIVSLANTAVTDDELALFRDFPYVQTLDLSHTGIGDNGLVHLAGLRALEKLIVVDTRITGPALATFQGEHPTVKVVTQPAPKGAVNPFTGKPF